MDLQRPDFSDSRDPIFLILGTRFSILGSRIGSLKHLKNTLDYRAIEFSH